MTASAPVYTPPHPINWTKVAFIFAAAVAIAGWVASYARADYRLVVLEARTAPLANGDLVRLQQDVTWIRQRLEREPDA